MKLLTLILILIFSITACNTVSSTNRPAEYFNQQVERNSDGTSLFSGDSALISDADIVKILDYQYAPPKSNRVAILNVGHSGWNGWSESVTVASKGIEQDLIKTLRKSERIYDAAYLPTILVPEKRTVPYLREAAARFQADLLFIYSSQCRSFTRSRILRTKRGRAYCNVESVILDTRTGLVPFVASSTQEFDIEEGERDVNYNEARIKSQIAATGIALNEIGVRLLTFVNESSAQ